ncbi:PhzF family phenazine biosynthesis protein [Sphingomonas lacunae]|uniref:PhzF family phenazine biosynthesis protein n=1 Tax=Sphingomonas lacunae TaxID=2698828 RepID=A0A6M4AXX3_9SPHN|nr:PhzF family phenazine biosynthesis protein [Sphingomonas lacunae]QJQ33232.1 PhzF family phenazine biosynthesis protein [Sphingomonas lacunae]
MIRRIHTVDVFTSTPLKGNPVAVVLDAHGLSTGEMQAIANWTNLSETTFILPPPPRKGTGQAGGGADPADTAPADYHIRIFTPRAELPFAGHPTIGSAHALLSAGLVTPRNGILIQHSAVGPVEVAVPADWREAGLSFRLPPHQISPAPDPDALTAALGTPPLAPPAIVNVGPRWVIAELSDGATVRALSPDLACLAAYDRRHATTGLTVFAADGQGRVAVRSFAPADGIAEDPVCGSGNGAVAAYRLNLAQTAVGHAYLASQGREVGRDGTIAIRYAADGIHVGGQAVTVIEGQLRL